MDLLTFWYWALEDLSYFRHLKRNFFFMSSFDSGIEWKPELQNI